MLNVIVDPATTCEISPRDNRILASLPAAELRALNHTLELVRLRRGRPLHEPGQDLADVYFPTSGIVSVHYADLGGEPTELAQIGWEGMVGLPTLLGGHPTIIRAVVQASGHGFRLPAAEARARFAEGGHFQALTLRFALAFMLQLSQTAVCNLRHSVDQQLCRWLLLSLDRLRGTEIEMTQELIACILGVRRQGVTEAAKRLEQRRIIAYNRGRIHVLDREALERSACECYGVAKRETTSMLAGSPPAGAKVAYR